VILVYPDPHVSVFALRKAKVIPEEVGALVGAFVGIGVGLFVGVAAGLVGSFNTCMTAVQQEVLNWVE
jgi:hypothetical protein